jgi:predicted PolB exonuclease-like 3'-5' exonuclease
MSTKRKYLAFDIETAKTTEDASDWRSFRPLGISCAATFLADSKDLRLWHGGTDRKSPADRMSREEAAALVRYLEDQTKGGYTVVTWNGLGFDLDILAEESGLLSQCRALAVDHVDMMFHVFCQLGHGVGLDAAAKGMGLAGKCKGMSGAVARVLWAQGKREEVLQYVAQDVRTTMDLATTCEFPWRAPLGRP